MCDGSPKAEEHGHKIGLKPQDKVLRVSPAPPKNNRHSDTME